MLTDFNHITLAEMELVQLHDRTDSKFIHHQDALPRLYEKLFPSFKVLEIENQRQIGYENVYFDTDDLVFYHQHHNEKLNRCKVRIRKYTIPGICYCEIKLRNNKRRMVKSRLQIPSMSNVLPEAARVMVENITGINPDLLFPQLKVCFSRTTLVNIAQQVRITIDLDLTVENGNRKKEYPDLVVVEIKNPASKISLEYFQIMKEIGVVETRISKYCIGIIDTREQVKYNRFKPVLLKINRITKTSVRR